MIKCPDCGSSMIEEGTLEGLATVGTVGFRPSKLRFLTLKTKIPVAAHVCLECGKVELRCDTDSLRDIVIDIQEPPLPT